MRARASLVILAAAAATTAACSVGSPIVTITDLRMLPEADGVLQSGLFTVHVAQPADASGSAGIKLHSLDLDLGGGVLLPVTSLVGDAPGEVAPGEEIARPMVFAVDRIDSGAKPFTACTVPEPYALNGTYFDEAQRVFFPIRSEPARFVATWLTGAAWTTSLGDAEPQLERDVAALADGSSVVVGTTAGRLDFSGQTLPGTQSTTPFIVKLDAAGKPAWSRFFALEAVDGSGLLEGPSFAAATPGGDIVVAGTFNASFDPGDGAITSAGAGDVFFTRLDSSGKALKTRHFGDASNQTVTSMNVDDAGNVILVGTLEGALDFGAGPIAPILDPSFTSYYAARLPEAGAPVYARVPLALTAPTRVLGAAGATGALILGGSFYGKGWLGADPVHTSDIETGFLEKLAPDGSVAWSAVTDGLIVLAVAIDQDDVVAAVTNVLSSPTLGGQVIPSETVGRLFLARLDPAGALRSATPIAASLSTDLPSLVVDGAGHALLAGGAAGSLFFSEIDRSGIELRRKSFGCAGWPLDLAVARTGPRDVVLASTFSGAIDRGQGSITTAGVTDLLLAKLPAQ
jgi:hypothetical protein